MTKPNQEEVPSIFDLLEPLSARLLERGGPDIRGGFARGTGGVDLPWLIETLANGKPLNQAEANDIPLVRNTRHSSDLCERLSDEADLCRNEGAADLAALLDEARYNIEKDIEALTEIARGMGEFNRDQLIHAENTIEHMRATALETLTKYTGEQS